MNAPKWFWPVLAACVLAVTAFYCWNVWFDNRDRSVAPMTDEERKAAVEAYRKGR
jgi:hypothetical protein